jgi:PleD family two-component response regulator
MNLPDFARADLSRKTGPLLESYLAEADMTPNLLSRDINRQLAVFVGGGTEALAVVEPVLDGRAYDIEFVAPDDEPYATIAALKPDLVVVSLDLERVAGFQLLTMLRLDPETASIPVLSYVKDDDVSSLGPAAVEPNPSHLPSMDVPSAQRH